MSEELLEHEVVQMEESEIDSLKTRLNQMGVKYHHKANVDTLRKLLNDKLNPEASAAPTVRSVLDEATALVRCKITCMNPAKREWQGEIFTAGNSVIGVVRKFIPYNSPAAESFHIPRILLGSMKERKFLQTRSIKTTSGATQETYLAQEFVVVELPPLTPEELKELADQQAANRGI